MQVAVSSGGGTAAFTQNATGSSLRNALLRAADAAVTHLTKKPGFFAGRLAFVSERTGTSEVYTSDLFFGEVLQLTSDRSQSVMPRWSPDGKHLAVVLFDHTNDGGILAINGKWRLAIVDAGFLLQIDDPFLVTYYIMRPELSVADCRKWAELRVEALNAALKGIPADRVRFHTCYSVNMGPRVHDMQLKDIVDIILKVNAQGYTFEAANPRHEHEWEEWKRAKIADDKVLLPGVITQSTVLVEHPELVAQRLVRFAGVVGRERVIASADCGFASFAGSNEVHPSIVWAKFKSLVDGAGIATKQLWKH